MDDGREDADSDDDYGPLGEIARPEVPEPPASARRPVRTWDVVLTIVLLVLMVAFAGITTFTAPYFAFVRTGCSGSVDCVTGVDALTTTLLVAPGLVSLIGTLVSVGLLSTRRLACWVPIVGILLIGGVLVFAVFSI